MVPPHTELSIDEAGLRLSQEGHYSFPEGWLEHLFCPFYVPLVPKAILCIFHRLLSARSAGSIMTQAAI